MAQERFDVVVVGAGPAGLTAAYFLARKGFEVAVLERGPEPGSKNIFGGRIYSYVLDKHFPGWRKETPIERWVRREELEILCQEGSITINYQLHRKPDGYDSFTAFLSRFLKWLALKAEEAGALVATGVRVDEILFEPRGVHGVRVGEERLEADYTLIAEGANTLLLERHGLRERPRTEDIAVGVKEVVKLDKKRIEERFGLEEWSGVARFILGPPAGAAFLYTLREYVALGAVYRPALMGEKEAWEVAEELRQHPSISRLIGDGILVEYSAHLIREGGMRDLMEKPYGPGYLVLGDAAGFILNTGFTIRGVDLAIESGRLAAEAVEKMRGGEDSSIYQKLLDESTIIKSMRKFKRAPKFFSNPTIYKTYPEMICELMNQIYTTGEEPVNLYPAIKKSIRGKTSIMRVLLDILAAVRSL